MVKASVESIVLFVGDQAVDAAVDEGKSLGEVLSLCSVDDVGKEVIPSGAVRACRAVDNGAIDRRSTDARLAGREQ
ncbi:hypothetical protein ACVOMV_27090 (plasmid) [Mesorhizobium atlanticum]